MTEQRREEAFRYIEAQLENGYIDLGFHDQDELEIIKEAIQTLKMVDKLCNIGCTSFQFTKKEWEKILERSKNESE